MLDGCLLIQFVETENSTLPDTLLHWWRWFFLPSCQNALLVCSSFLKNLSHTSNGGAIFVTSSGLDVVARETLFDVCEEMGINVEGGTVFLSVKSGWFVETCAIGCYAKYCEQSLRCEFESNGVSCVNYSTIFACQREFGYAWSLNCQHGYIAVSFFNLSKSRIKSCVLAIYYVRNKEIYSFTLIVNNTAEASICFAQDLSPEECSWRAY